MRAINRRFFLRGLFILFLALIVVTSCKKKRAFNEESSQDAVDIRITTGEVDEVIKDVNTVIMEQYLLRGRGTDVQSGTSGTTSICGALLDTSQLTDGIVTILYQGANCYGKTRSGNVKFTIIGHPLKKWKHQGCQIKIEYIGYKVLRSTDGKSVAFEGTQTMLNESGNTWFELWYMGEPQVNYSLTGSDFKITFEGTDILKFNFNRRLTYTFSNLVTSCTVEGKGSAEGKSNLESWGSNRQGIVFTTQVTEPYLWKTNCGAIAPVNGEVVVKLADREHELACVFAVDKDGNDVSGRDNPCPFGYQVSWKFKKKTNKRVFSYY